MLSVAAADNQEIAVSIISEAEQSIVQTYEAVLDAEKAGANVSDLLVRLNDAAGLLSEAHIAFEADNFEDATRFADSASEVAWNVGSEAEKLEDEANNANANRLRWFTVGSILGVSIVISASLLGYRYFKRRYYRRLLKMRPKGAQP